MRQCEFKKKYNQELGKYQKQHIYDESIKQPIYGEGILDSISNFLFNETTKKAAKKVLKKATTAALNKTGNYIGNKSGDKIISLLQKQSSNKNQNLAPNNQHSQLSDYEINERVQRLLGSGIKRKIRKLKI